MPAWATIERGLRRALALNVRRAREGSSLTLYEAAQRAGIHWRHWQKVEAGEANATLNTIAKLAAALGVSALELLAPPSKGDKEASE